MVDFSPASSAGYAARKSAEAKAKAAVTIAGISEAGETARAGIDLLRELVRAGVSNPICGACASIIIADILQRAHIISGNAEGLVDGIAVAVAGVTLGAAAASEAVNLIDALDPLDMFKSNTSPPNDLKPSASVVVFGDGGGRDGPVARALSGRTLAELP